MMRAYTSRANAATITSKFTADAALLVFCGLCSALCVPFVIPSSELAHGCACMELEAPFMASTGLRFMTHADAPDHARESHRQQSCYDDEKRWCATHEEGCRMTHVHGVYLSLY